MAPDYVTREELATAKEAVLDLMQVCTQLVVNQGQVHDQELELRKRLGKIVYALRPPAKQSDAA
jgi:hypothetical protein